MWDNLLRVDWGRLTHAYGRARDMPNILRNMIAGDENTRAKGWDVFWGAINHQGDYYDSTVAAIPFLIEAIAHSGIPERARILYSLRDRWLDAPVYGGDPLVPEPPGGTDIPTPMLAEEELVAVSERAFHESTEENHDEELEEEFDLSSYRRMDLCAWQTGRAIQSGRPTFVRLLEDRDREVAAAAAALLLLWPETRALGKQALIRTIAEEVDPVEQGGRILEFGVYAANEDVDTLAEWIAPHQLAPMRAAAALVWAWVVTPGPLPEPAAATLHATSVPSSDAFAKLPRVGVYHRGPWILPGNAAELILRLAEHNEKELRWRAVQGLEIGHETAKHLSAEQVVPVLLKRLSDDYNRIRAAAALALSQRGEAVLDFEPNAVPILIRALEKNKSQDWGDGFRGLDTDSSICGNAARLLTMLSHRLTAAQRKEALAGIDRAVRRYAGRKSKFIMFGGMGIQASPFLTKQRNFLLKSAQWGLAELFAEFAFADRGDRRLSPKDCDRRLADAYTRAPKQTVADAIQTVRAASDRDAAIGAALWLMTLGPAAEAALEALDGMAIGQLDDYAREQALAASNFIRQSLLVTRDVEGEPATGGTTARHQVARLLRAAAEANLSGHEQGTLITELIGFLEHSDAYVRAGAAEALAKLTATTSQVAAAIPVLERMLTDEAFAEVGILGEYECEGRLFHWRQERRSPRAGAIRALFAMGRIPDGDRMLKAMLAESMHAQVLCGKSAAAHRFTIAQWGLAVDAAGGLSMADPLIHVTQQHCQSQPWPGNNAPYVCAAEISEVIRQLSGRRVR